MKTHEPMDHSTDDTALDHRVRQALDESIGTPDTAAARLVRRALAEGDAQPRVGWRRPGIGGRWWLAPATLAAAMALVMGLDLLESPSTTDPGKITPATTTAALRISNQGGVLSITTAAGTKTVFVPANTVRTEGETP